MPMKPARRCSQPGCGVMINAGDRCPTHPREPWRRPGQVKRIRGRTLKRLRSALFADSPLCVLCERAGLVRVATIRDHIVPLGEGGTDDRDNIQALCGPCSDAKTRDEANRGKRRAIVE
jgi:5-methylcytosine-specific restriction protein A